ncbi:hypothetical protein MUN81_06210 [Hymenobacter sp. 5317J-9]|uniref:hypothetical protein n=1 Tax=Hymenobacter sp. 5317J-9 TaxID=2932250 RepID=UPI001FD64491|nr:hypothetical protein [Hymenobacter sp. 5317J-9]UOQ99081.1 hypothetical protein MUN81_06210 [Hymenobacter sp. 5317J-9]
MKKTLFSLAAALGLLAASHAASAQTTPGITARQRNERARIRNGVASGDLTRAEAARLKAREADIRQDKQAAKADGVVTRDERQDIRRDEHKASRAIHRQRHDAQVRR